MVPTIRPAHAANTLPEPMSNDNDSDLDDYQQEDNQESQRGSEFQPPLSDNDVFIAESLVSAPADISNTVSLRPICASEPPTADEIATICTTEVPLASSSPVGTSGPLTVQKVDGDDHLADLLTAPHFIYHPVNPLTHPPTLTKNSLMELSPL